MILNPFRPLFWVSIVLPITFVFASGCSGLFTGKEENTMKELLPDAKEIKPKFVEDSTYISTYKTIAVHGTGLVVGLPGTGGEDASTPHYQRVYNDMLREDIPNAKAILASSQTAVVEVTGYMRPGIQEGERFDVEVRLPQGSETKSLSGGRLMPTKLSEMMNVGDSIKEGDPRAIVEGAIMVDLPLTTDAGNQNGVKVGKILNGARTLKSRSLSLVSKMDSKSPFWNDQIARAINARFPKTSQMKNPVATAKTDSIIFLDVHPSYAQDIPRYVRVVQSIVYLEKPVQQLQRIERLKGEVLHPETSQQAALQLEAIGKLGIEALQEALRSPNNVVRFHAATSLAYLGDSSSAKILAETAQQDQAFRYYALNALSTIRNDLDAEYYLQELLHVPSAETRYGAFRALKNRNPLDQTIRGEVLGGRFGQFSFHGINTPSAPMVHLTAQKNPELVLFGTNITLKQPFALDAGPTIFVNGQSPEGVVITRLGTSGVDERRTVSNRLEEIVRAVCDLEGTYPDVFQMIRQAERQGVLLCRLEIDCLPESDRIYQRQREESETVSEEEKPPKSFWERMNPKNLFMPNPGEGTSDFTGTVNAPSRN